MLRSVWHNLMDSTQRSATTKKMHEELRVARVEYDEASKQFRKLIADVPSGAPAPDGGLELKRAGASARGALRRYMAALSTLHNFELRGTVPDTFKNE
jgi:hypothetical protein